MRAEVTSAVSARTRAGPRWTGRCGQGGRGGGVASGRGRGGRAGRREAGKPACRRRGEPAPAPAAPPAAQQASLQDSGAGNPLDTGGLTVPSNRRETGGGEAREKAVEEHAQVVHEEDRQDRRDAGTAGLSPLRERRRAHGGEETGGVEGHEHAVPEEDRQATPRCRAQALQARREETGGVEGHEQVEPVEGRPRRRGDGETGRVLLGQALLQLQPPGNRQRLRETPRRSREKSLDPGATYQDRGAGALEGELVLDSSWVCQQPKW